MSKLANIHFFLDYSNIWLSGLESRQLPSCQKDRFRISASRIRELACGGRQWKLGFAAAGFKQSPTNLIESFRRSGVQFRDLERGCRSGMEQGVDATIQCEMILRTLQAEKGDVVVLATGDGNGWERFEGFLPTVQFLRHRGLSIELMSWGHSVNSKLADWCSQFGKYICLDQYYSSLTYVEGERQPHKLKIA